MRNNSSAPLGISWFQGNTAVFTSQAGAANAYIAANYQSTNGTIGTETISNWLVLPPLSVSNGSRGQFRLLDQNRNRFEVSRIDCRSASARMAIARTSGLARRMLAISPLSCWILIQLTQWAVIRRSGRHLVCNFLACRVGLSESLSVTSLRTEALPELISNYIGIDSVAYDCHATTCIPSEGTPTPTPSPTATPTATPTPATAAISGTVALCAAATPVPLVGVTITLTGSSSGVLSSDGAGAYQFVGLSMSGNYTVTPTKASRAPGSNGITTVDVIAEQNHALNRVLLTGCRLSAGDCAGAVE